MSIFDKVRATTPGILDSEAFESNEEQLNAKMLRELVRTGNFMRDAGSIMLIDSWAINESNNPVAGAEDRIVYAYAEIPSRPIHTKAEIRLRASVETSASVIWRFQFDNSPPSNGYTQVGTGSVATVTDTVSFPPGDRHSFIISIRRELAPAALTATIGTPNTWTSDLNTSVIEGRGIHIDTSSWNTAPFRNGAYELEATNSTNGGLLARKPILDLSSEPVSSNQLLVTDAWTNEELRAVVGSGSIVPNGVTFTIRKRPFFNIESLLVRGVP